MTKFNMVYNEGFSEQRWNVLSVANPKCLKHSSETEGNILWKTNLPRYLRDASETGVLAKFR